MGTLNGVIEMEIQDGRLSTGDFPNGPLLAKLLRRESRSWNAFTTCSGLIFFSRNLQSLLMFFGPDGKDAPLFVRTPDA